jgi:hypothetical protein
MKGNGMNGLIQEELDRAGAALRSGALTDKQYCEIYAIQQALFWAAEPQSVNSPVDTVMEGKVQPPIRERS